MTPADTQRERRPEFNIDDEITVVPDADYEQLREALEQAAYEAGHNRQLGHLERGCVVCRALPDQPTTREGSEQ